MTTIAVPFDVDGTLVDINRPHAQVWRGAFAPFGLVMPVETVQGQIGKGGDTLMPALLGPAVVERQGEAISRARSRICKKSHAGRAEPFGDVANLFRRARHDSWAIAIAPFSPGEEREPHLDRLGGCDPVDAVTTADDAERSKPHPDTVAAAPTKAGAAALFDHPADLLARYDASPLATVR